VTKPGFVVILLALHENVVKETLDPGPYLQVHQTISLHPRAIDVFSYQTVSVIILFIRFS